MSSKGSATIRDPTWTILIMTFLNLGTSLVQVFFGELPHLRARIRISKPTDRLVSLTLVDVGGANFVDAHIDGSQCHSGVAIQVIWNGFGHVIVTVEIR